MELQTPSQEGTPPQVPVKFLNKRVSAFLMDLAFVSLVSFSLLGDLSSRMADKGLMPAAMIFEGLYLLLRDGLFKGRSLGKLAVGIQVVDLNGKPCNFWKSVLRNLVFVAPGAIAWSIFSDLVLGFILRFFSVVYLIEYSALRFSPETRRLGDRLAKTCVIDTRPHWKDSPFLWVSLTVFFVVFLGVPALRFAAVNREVKTMAATLEEHKKTYGTLPRKLDELNVRSRSHVIYTPYRSVGGSTEFYLTGSAAPFPNFSYSSERREWRVHRGGTAWTQEEMGINETRRQAQSHYEQGLDFQNQKVFDLAEQEFREAVRIFPGHVTARLALASLWMGQERWDEALPEYEAIVDLAPDNAETHLNRFLIFYKQNRFRKALAAHRAYLKRAPPGDEEKRRQAEAITQDLEDKTRAGAQETKTPPQVPVEAESIKNEVEEEAQQQKVPPDLFSGIEAGAWVSIRLKNGSSISGKWVSKDRGGFWLEIGERANAYFTHDEVEGVNKGGL